jgi:anti-sigma factor RsiW
VREQHLSDEAIAACADDVLPGLARGRALRHVDSCAECAYAVAGQREAAYVLRAAPAPLLPFGLLDRLRDVPTTTPLTTVPGSIAPDGTAMFATFGSMHFTMSPTAFVEPVRPAAQRNEHGPLLDAARPAHTGARPAIRSAGRRPPRGRHHPLDALILGRGWLAATRLGQTRTRNRSSAGPMSRSDA